MSNPGTPAPLPDGFAKIAYSQTLSAKGGSGSYTWTVDPESGPLPDGLSLSPEGEISGTPTAAGEWSFTVRVSSGDRTARLQLSISVHATPTVTTTVLPDAVVDAAFSHTLAAADVHGSYTWGLAPDSPRLPPGLHLAHDGELTGTPRVAGVWEFTVQVTSGAWTVQRTLGMTVKAPLTVITQTLTAGVKELDYRHSLEATGGDGSYAWGLAATSGRLPAGLSVAPHGEITGTPGAVGEWSITVEVTSGHQRAQQTLEIPIREAHPESASPPGGSTLAASEGLSGEPGVSGTSPVAVHGVARLRVLPSLRSAAVALLSLGIAALVWIPSARALFPWGAAPPEWYGVAAGGRVDLYADLYPLFYLVFVQLLPVFMIGRVVQAGLARVFRSNASWSRPDELATPVGIRVHARAAQQVQPPAHLTRRAHVRRAIAIQLGVISVLLITYPGFAGASDTIGSWVGALACVLALVVWRSGSAWGLSMLGLFGVVQAATFALVLRDAPLPFEYRPVLVLIATLYLGLPVFLLGMLLPRARAGALVVLMMSLAGAVLVVETAGSLLLLARGGVTASSQVRVDPTYVLRHRGELEQHPEMGAIPIPNSVTETLYPDNPRDAFRARSLLWRVRDRPSSEASLDFLGDDIAVQIERADDPGLRAIIAERGGLDLVEGAEYVLRFLIRSSRERDYQVALRAPGAGGALGLSFDATAGPDWTSVVRPFRARSFADSGQVDLRLGGDTADVYVSDFSVTEAEGGARADRGSGVEYYVSYTWNSRGCRASEYPIPPAPRTFRILALGDSYTVGQGVPGGAVFTAVMERLLERRAAEAQDPRRFEVVGCGVSGFGTREERLYYEERASAYQPDLVLLVMTEDDDRAFSPDELSAFVHTPSRWEYFVHTGYLVRSIRHARPEADFSASMAELAELHERVRQDGAELAVVVFANETGPTWDLLSVAADSTARSLGIPILNLSEWLVSEDPPDEPNLIDSLVSEDAPDELTVHAIDGHPNEIAHRIAAREILDWLDREGLVALSP